MPYLPGTHVIASLTTMQSERLQKSDPLKKAIDTWILEFGLQSLGAVYHDFTPEGFTAVVCLSESHLSVHTWPEFQRVNLDIYLSNHQRNNDGTVHALYQRMVEWFGGKIIQEQTLQR